MRAQNQARALLAGKVRGAPGKPAALKRPRISRPRVSQLQYNPVRSSAEAGAEQVVKAEGLAGAVPEPAGGLLLPAPIALF